MLHEFEYDVFAMKFFNEICWSNRCTVGYTLSGTVATHPRISTDKGNGSAKLQRGLWKWEIGRGLLIVPEELCFVFAGLLLFSYLFLNLCLITRRALFLPFCLQEEDFKKPILTVVCPYSNALPCNNHFRWATKSRWKGRPSPCGLVLLETLASL